MWIWFNMCSNVLLAVAVSWLGGVVVFLLNSWLMSSLNSLARSLTMISMELRRGTICTLFFHSFFAALFVIDCTFLVWAGLTAFSTNVVVNLITWSSAAANFHRCISPVFAWWFPSHVPGFSPDCSWTHPWRTLCVFFRRLLRCLRFLRETPFSCRFSGGSSTVSLFVRVFFVQTLWLIGGKFVVVDLIGEVIF